MKSLSCPHDTLVATSLVCHCEQTLTRVPAEVWTEVKDWRHGRVYDNGGARPVRRYKHGTRTRVLNVDLNPVLKPATTDDIQLKLAFETCTCMK